MRTTPVCVHSNFAYVVSFTDTKGSISEQQFDLSTDDDRPSKYYYHPIRTDLSAVDFNEFCAKINSCKKAMWEAELPSETTLNFRWLDDYREIGEVKQELKKRQSQYIVYKDIMYVCLTIVSNQSSD